MTLTPQEREAIIKYRIERSRDTIKEVKDIGKLGYWNLAASRLYYAAYYASIALLISEGIEATTYKGTLRMIGLSFVKNEILCKEDAQLLGRLYSMRQTGDYDDLFDWTEADVAPLIPQVEDYIRRVTLFIEKK